MGPHGATFQDGYRTEVICDAIVDPMETIKHIDITIARRGIRLAFTLLTGETR